MDKYDELKSRIDEYLRLPDVIEDKEIISAYTLYKLLYNRFYLLKHPYYTSEFIKLLNEDNLEIIRKGKFFKRYIKKEPDNKCDRIYFDSDLTKSEIQFSFRNESEEMYYPNNFEICKDRNNLNMYTKFAISYYLEKYFNKLIEKYQDRLMEIFEVLEYFSDLLQDSIKNIDSPVYRPQVFSDGFLDISIKYYCLGDVYLDIIINKSIDIDNVQTTRYLNRETLASYLDNNADTILNKVAIEIQSLNDVSKQIIEEDYLCTREKPAVLSLRSDNNGKI